MSSFQPSSLQSYKLDAMNIISSERNIYENLLLILFAKRGYKLLKDVNGKFVDFAIGRRVGLEEKIDDIVFRYEDKDNKKNLIFVQIKNKRDHYQIDSQVLSAEISRETGRRGRDFNLKKHFISYLRVRDELNDTKSKELENGKIKYIAIFTNIGLDIEELNDKGFSLKEAPYDIINLFSLKKSSSKTDYSNHCYQLGDVSENLRRKLKESSDLHRLAWQIADYVVWKSHRENCIIGINIDPMRYYHVALVKEVIEKSEQVRNKSYSDAKFNDNFLNNNEPGPKKELRDEIFKVVRELDLSKRDISDDDLKNILKGVNLKVVPNFGKSSNRKKNLPDKWMKIEDDDIADFLKCFVFLVNQPNVKDLLSRITQVREAFSQNDRVIPTLDKIYPKFKCRIEKELGIYIQKFFKAEWLCREQTVQFAQEIMEAVCTCIMPLIYQNQVMQYGRFNNLGQLLASLESFLKYENGGKISDVQQLFKTSKVLCVWTHVTLFTTVKIVQFLSENHITKYCYIPIEMDNLKYEEIIDRVNKVFRPKSHNYLVIRCIKVKEQVVKETYDRLFDTIIRNHCKRIILIARENVADQFKCYQYNLHKGQCYSDKIYIEETDYINLEDFVPGMNPLFKTVVVFQGQKEKNCLSRLMGITSWQYFIERFFIRERSFSKQEIIDLILNNNVVEIGSHPLGTSSLDGAYTILFEEISIETLAKKFLLLGSDNNNHNLKDPFTALFQLFSQEIDDNNDVYIMSGIEGSSKEEKIDKLIQYLDLVNEQEEIENLFGDIGSDSNIQIADDQIKDEDFKRVCCNKPEKRIFWIDIIYEGNGLKFILRQLYNPKFYLKRNLKQVIVMKEVKEQLMEKYLAEIFIFCGVKDQQVLIDSLKFMNESEKVRFKNNFKISFIKLVTEEADAKAKFYELFKTNRVVNFLKFINKDLNEIYFIKEYNLIREIKDRKVVIIAGEAGMGKTTTLTKLYETKNRHESFIETHWVIRINMKYHTKPIRDLVRDNINTVSVVNFLSKIDVKLNNNLAKCLLTVALDKRKIFLKPLLLAFDGFDEILDEDDRNNLILLFKFLKKESAAKLWITTSLRYKKTLENELSTFALEFDTMDDDFNVAYVKQYLKDRLCLSEKKIAELFVHDNEKQETIQMHVAAFLDRMKSVFTGNTSRFIGTPLQLYVMLDGSERHFKKWIEQDKAENLTFNYLGDDLCEVYEKFIDNKYQVYFQKEGIRERIIQRYETLNLDKYATNLAMSLILGRETTSYFEEFKYVVLSVGIFKSFDNSIEFIHTTFRDYFAAKAFFRWLKKKTNVASNSFKKEYILKEVLRKPDYQLIRGFINIMLKNVMETKMFEECLKYYGMIIGKLLKEEEESHLMDEKGTVLHIAVDEGNTNIVLFLLESLKRQTDVLQKFLFISDKDKRTALHIAVDEGSTNIVRVLLKSLKGHKEVLRELMYTTDNDKVTVLHLACSKDDDEILKLLLEAAK